MPRHTFTVPTGPRVTAPYVPAARGGEFVSISGQCGYRQDKSLAEGFEAQARLALDNLFAALTAAGSAETDVVNVGVFIANGDDFDQMNRIYREYFSEPYPTRTTVTVGLRPGVLFEVNAQAVVDTQRAAATDEEPAPWN